MANSTPDHQPSTAGSSNLQRRTSRLRRRRIGFAALLTGLFACITTLAFVAPASAAGSATYGSYISYNPAFPASETVPVAYTGLAPNTQVHYAAYQSGTCAAPGTPMPVSATAGTTDSSGNVNPWITVTVPSSPASGTGLICATPALPTSPPAFDPVPFSFPWGPPAVTSVSAVQQGVGGDVILHVTGVRFPDATICALYVVDPMNNFGNSTTPHYNGDFDATTGAASTQPTITWQIRCGQSNEANPTYGPVTTAWTAATTTSPSPSPSPSASASSTTTTTTTRVAPTPASVAPVTFKPKVAGPAAKTGVVSPQSQGMPVGVLAGLGAALLLGLGAWVWRRTDLHRR